MNLTLQLTPETEAKLRQQASLAGVSVEELAMEALREKLAHESEPGPPLTVESRLAEFRGWLAAHRASTAEALDDSRASI